MKKQIAGSYKSLPIAELRAVAQPIMVTQKDIHATINFVVNQLDEKYEGVSTKKAVILLRKVLPFLPHTPNKDRVSDLWKSMKNRTDSKDTYKYTQALWPIFPADDIAVLQGRKPWMLDNDIKGFLESLKLFLKHPDKFGELNLRDVDLSGLSDADLPCDLKKISPLTLHNTENVSAQLIGVALRTCRGELNLEGIDLSLLKNADIPDDLSHLSSLNLNSSKYVPDKLISVALATCPVVRLCGVNLYWLGDSAIPSDLTRLSCLDLNFSTGVPTKLISLALATCPVVVLKHVDLRRVKDKVIPNDLSHVKYLWLSGAKNMPPKLQVEDQKRNLETGLRKELKS